MTYLLTIDDCHFDMLIVEILHMSEKFLDVQLFFEIWHLGTLSSHFLKKMLNAYQSRVLCLDYSENDVDRIVNTNRMIRMG